MLFRSSEKGHNIALEGILTQAERDMLERLRYLSKVQGYKNAGFDILPQDKKYTGFELVKKELEKTYNDGWSFEKLYRHPLTEFVRELKLTYKLNDEVIDTLSKLDIKQLTSSLEAPAGI